MTTTSPKLESITANLLLHSVQRIKWATFIFVPVWFGYGFAKDPANLEWAKRVVSQHERTLWYFCIMPLLNTPGVCGRGTAARHWPVLVDGVATGASLLPAVLLPACYAPSRFN